MLNFSELREKYPQYKDLPDEELASKFHEKFYADMPREEFNSKIGFNSQNVSRETKPEEKPSFLDSLGKTNAGQFAKGVGTSLWNLSSDIGSLIPGPHPEIEKVARVPGVAGTAGEIVGDLLPYNRGMKAIQAFGKGIPYLQGALRVAGNGAYGALRDQENPGKGAAIGTVLGGLGEVIPSTARAFTNPGKLAKGFQEFKQSEKKTAEDLYNNVRDVAGDVPLYEIEIGAKQLKDPFTGAPTGMSQEKYALKGLYKRVPDKVFEHDTKIKELNDIFKSQPTVANAHALQSQIGSAIGRLQKKTDMASGNAVHELRAARKAIRSDLMAKLGEIDEGLAGQYQKATDIFREHVVPLAGMVKKTPKEILSKLKSIGEKREVRLGEKKGQLSSEITDRMEELEKAFAKRKFAGAGLGIGAAAAGLGATHDPVLIGELALGGLMGSRFGGKSSPPRGTPQRNQMLKNVLTGAGSQVGNIGRIELMKMLGQ